MLIHRLEAPDTTRGHRVLPAMSQEIAQGIPTVPIRDTTTGALTQDRADLYRDMAPFTPIVHTTPIPLDVTATTTDPMLESL